MTTQTLDQHNVTTIEVVGTLTPTALVRALLVDPAAARHVYALLGAVLTNEGIITDPRKRKRIPDVYVSPADRDAAMEARRTEGTIERQRLLLGMAVRIMRIGAHMERKELARRADISYPFLSEIETGNKSMSDSTLLSIALTLDCEPSDIHALAESL